MKCDFATKTNAALEKHKIRDHALSFISASTTSPSTSIAHPSTSTRDNSIVGILNEDISVIDLLDDSLDHNSKDTIDETVMPSHMKETRNESKFHCVICQDGFPEEEQLSKHEMKHEELNHIVKEMPIVVECALCEYSSVNLKEVDTHREVMHKDMSKANQVQVSDSIFICPKCGKQFEEIGLLERHQEDHINLVGHTPEKIAQEFKFKCCYCKFETNDIKISENHGSKNHGIINCERCDYSALDETIMKKPVSASI